MNRSQSRSLRTLLVAALALFMLIDARWAVAQDDAPKPAPPREPGRQTPPPDAPRPGQDGRPVRPAAEAAKWMANIEFVNDVVYATVADAEGKQRELRLDAAFPKQSGDKPLPAVIYIHGGGWSSGSRNAGLPFNVAFANGGYFAVTIDYRLSGEAKFPAAMHDCKAAVRFLRANAEQLGIDPNRIGVWGHSAGGHLSSLIALTGDDPALEGDVGMTGASSKVACFVSVSGPSALAGFADNNMVADFLGSEGAERAKLAEQASPITYVDKNDPPALLVHGTNDELVNIRQAQLLLEKLQTAGVKSELYQVDGAGHGIREKAAYEKIAAFFDEQLGGSASKVFSELDWLHLNELQPGQGPPQRQPNDERPRRPRDGAQQPGDDAPPPPKPSDANADNQPKPLDAATVNTMTREQLEKALAARAVAIRRTDHLDQETRDRLINEFKLIQNRLRIMASDAPKSK